MRITHWTLKIKWEDGTEEYINDIPNFVASHVDPFLDKLEALRAEDEELGTGPIGSPTEIQKIKE